MYYYKFDTTTSPLPSDIQIVDAKPTGYIAFNSGEPVDWTVYTHSKGKLIANPVPTPPAPYVPTLTERKTQKLIEISSWTRTAIVGGFISSAIGSPNRYDSDESDQQNLALMLQATASPDFSTHPTYHGKVPIRAVPDGEIGKIVLLHDATQVRKVIDDLALHIGACKQKGWGLQESVDIAVSPDDLDKVVWPA